MHVCVRCGQQVWRREGWFWGSYDGLHYRCCFPDFFGGEGI